MAVEISTIFFFTAFVGSVFVLLYHKLTRRKPVFNSKPDKVILHFKTLGSPELSPFRLKLETYLKLCQIPYELSHIRQLSSKGKLPWIEHNGVVVEDTQFCIDYLNNSFNVDLNEKLSPYERSLSRAFQVMIEENTTWCLLLSRWKYERKPKFFQALKVNVVFTYLITKSLMRKSSGHGIGLHTWEEIKSIAKKDLTALSDFLGEKKYLFGNFMTLADCSAFGLLVQICYNHTDSYLHQLVNDSFPNLKDYCDRIRNEYYPDMVLLS
ncbi:Hypothetical predicted protein [Octopus vulgaris]|uniref:Failed axon connections homolog n=1 Tax=Octopus vulgaris TaxID=6645 RepID=A0AA36AT67_OCTVU|nr:Hypothetical predicted protein [Octopus vulgaris]